MEPSVSYWMLLGFEGERSEVAGRERLEVEERRCRRRIASVLCSVIAVPDASVFF
jgi:hypothetical protein